ncbi:MAG: hypothetical protein WA966_08355, partial [Ornithinimicrobium sp.]
MTDLEEYVEQFRGRVVQEALAAATASFWRHRAAQFEDARPREGDFTGRATTEDLAAADHRMAETAQACRNRARISLILDENGEDRQCCFATDEDRAELDRLGR